METNTTDNGLGLRRTVGHRVCDNPSCVSGMVKVRGTRYRCGSCNGTGLIRISVPATGVSVSFDPPKEEGDDG